MRGIRGFTLLEIVIALAIFAVGLVGLLSLFPVSFQSAKRATDLTEATIYAQEIIEDLKRQGYDNITDGTTTDNSISGTSRFTYDKIVTSGGSLPSGLRKISITMEWIEGGKTYDEDFVTYVADLTP